MGIVFFGMVLSICIWMFVLSFYRDGVVVKDILEVELVRMCIGVEECGCDLIIIDG